MTWANPRGAGGWHLRVSDIGARIGGSESSCYAMNKEARGRGKRVVVIGAGLGGMSAALSLAAAGYRVEVYEKNPRVGGKLNVLEKEGFSFDLGPSIFTLPHIFQELFARAGKRFEDYVSIQRVTPHWRNFFEDGRVIDLLMDPKAMRAELEKLPDFSEALWQEWEGFLRYSKEQYDIVVRGYFREGLDTLWDFVKFYGIFGIASKIDWRSRMSESIARRISQDRKSVV